MSIKRLLVSLFLIIGILCETVISFAELTDISQFLLPAPNSSEITLEFAFDFDKNLIFQTYGVSMYIDDQHIVDLAHGQGYRGKIKIKPGPHKLCFYKSDDDKWNGIIDFSISDYTFVTGKIHTRYTKVDVSQLKLKKRYDMVSGEDLQNLKEYDRIIDNLCYYYNVAYWYGGKTGRRTGHYSRYYLFNTEKKTFLRFGDSTGPAGTTSHHIYDPVFGSYTGDLSSGNIVLRNGSYENTVNDFLIDDDKKLKEYNFQSACKVFVEDYFKELSLKILYLSFDLKKQNLQDYYLIFPDGY